MLFVLKAYHENPLLPAVVLVVCTIQHKQGDTSAMNEELLDHQDQESEWYWGA